MVETLPSERRADAREALRRAGIRERDPWWALMRLALGSPAQLCSAQAQDVLGLGSEARMNFPAGRRASGAGGWSPASSPRAARGGCVR